MTKDTPTQELLIELETALHRLVESFWEAPYQHFTEADAVAALESWVARRPGLSAMHRTADGFETGLLHRDYPTFFRFHRQAPTQRREPPARRGWYNLALLDPGPIRQVNAETVLNRNVTDRGAFARPPLLAALQVQLYAQGWSVGRVRRVRRDVGKLGLALAPPADARAAYLCILQRDVGSQPTRWDRHWPVVERMLAGAPGICTVVAVSWPHAALEPFVHYTGPWITVEEGTV